MTRFSIARDALAQALDRAAGIVDVRSTSPILNTVRIVTDGGGLTLTATDMDMIFQERVDAESRETWAGCIEVRRLIGFVKTLPRGGEVTLTASEQRIEIRQDRAVARLPVMSPDDFPGWQLIGEPAVCEIEGAELQSMLHMVGSAMPDKNERSHLWGVHLDGERSTAVATDGHRLALRRIAGLPPDTNIIVPAPTCLRLQSMLRGFTETVRLRLSPRAVEFECGSWTLKGRLLDGTYPDYWRVLPSRVPAPLIVNRVALAQAVERVSLVAQGTHVAVRLTAKNGELTVTAAADGGFGDGEDAVAAEGEDVGPIAINGRYLDEALDALEPAETVEFHVTSPSAPLWICATPHDDGIVIVPLRF
jgi:DNA polymerase-3 subunit beta